MPPPETTPLTAVICHFNPSGHPYLRRLVALAVASLQRAPDPALTILVVDGSPDPDPELATLLNERHTRYLHTGHPLGFAATYNNGVAAATTEIVILLANDILADSRQLRRLAAELTGNVACAIPFLTRSDYPGQIDRQRRLPRRSYPAAMTINVNAFRRDRLLAAGGIPEELTGFFNDTILFHRLRRQGDAILLVNVGEVEHLQAVTRRISSDTRFADDRAAAPALAPDLFAGLGPGTRNLWAHLFARSAQRPLPRLLWRLVSLVPWQLDLRRGLPYAVATLEPYLATDWRIYPRALRPRRRRRQPA